MNKNKYIALNINPSLEIDWGLLYNDSMCAHVISDVIKDSPAGKAGLKPGERLVSINGEAIEDIFDYQYLGIGEKLTLSLESEDGSERTVEIFKDEDEDLGLIFDNGLMDDYRHCTNKCIFCFIDQIGSSTNSSSSKSPIIPLIKDVIPFSNEFLLTSPENVVL